MCANKHLPAYYRQRYVSWYSWFSRIYDPFAKALLFVLNGGPGGERRLREFVIDRLEPSRGDRVIDICSGTGTLSLMLAERLSGTGEIQGIEISKYQLAIARGKKIPDNVTFKQGDAQHLPFDDSYFDRAVIFGALHEIPRDARRSILAQARRVLKPGGRIVILEHNRPARTWRAVLYRFLEWPSPEYSTYVDLLESGLQNEIAGAGFRVLDIAVVASQYFQVVVAEKPGPDAT
jgi:ubiquinone/menaquinone biosynthesis C-methylase UbiE